MLTLQKNSLVGTLEKEIIIVKCCGVNNCAVVVMTAYNLESVFPPTVWRRDEGRIADEDALRALNGEFWSLTVTST
jgi:hypothetical protein